MHIQLESAIDHVLHCMTASGRSYWKQKYVAATVTCRPERWTGRQAGSYRKFYKWKPSFRRQCLLSCSLTWYGDIFCNETDKAGIDSSFFPSNMRSEKDPMGPCKTFDYTENTEFVLIWFFMFGIYLQLKGSESMWCSAVRKVRHLQLYPPFIRLYICQYWSYHFQSIRLRCAIQNRLQYVALVGISKIMLY